MSTADFPLRPVLGVTCCRRSVGGEAAQSVMERYVASALRYADAAGLLVPALPELMRAREIAPLLDGLLLTGSPSNVEPARYGQAGAEDRAGPYDPARDAMAAALVEEMLNLGKPVFGVCRGLQELNVILGGTLRRDLSRSPDLIDHHAPADADLGAMFAHSHEVALTPGGLLARSFGRPQITVNSVHFQGLDRLAPGLTVEATAPDGIVEAVSADILGAQVLAVQWHPEWRPETNPDSQMFFQLLGRALRGERLLSPPSRSCA
ncbi:gamma-glutamyl-gamma-aminobutyrate hydrolase family protein [Phenylobacterium sp. LjRoot225]|uniref:gamma-glutamyl-gamma-aminobutyrate hydrolase family protein n=1 Tax=Phenylobacterium sp. LjRoot225 TaxID=3342285 RepID=UPI003ECCD108